MDARSDESRSRKSRTPSDVGGVAQTVGQGLVGGAISTLVMTAFRAPIARSLPPTAEFWARYVGDGEPSDYPVVGLLLHLLYGTIGGGLFSVLLERRKTAGRMDEQRGGVWGVLYGFALSLFGLHVVLKLVLRMNLESDEQFVFHAGHLIYGLTLGTWLGSRAE